MAIRNYTGFDGGGTNQCSATSGTFSVQNTTARNGGYALRVNPTTTAVGYVELADLDAAGLNTTNGNAPDAYVNFYFRIATAPSSGNEEIFVARSSSADKCSVRLNSDRTLSFYNSADTLVATGATVLATNTWYLIGVYIGDGTTAPWRVEINGSTEISSAVSGTTNLLTANNARFRFGKVTNKNGNSVDFYYDDIIWDNAAFVGEHRQYCIAPDGDGAIAQFTGGTGASNYTQVNEIPINDSTYIVSTGASQRHLVSLPSAASAGITGSILSLQVFLRIRDHGSSATTLTATTVRINSTNYDSGTANASTTVVTRNPIWNTNPNSGSAWTLSDFDNVEIGILENNANPTRCTTILAFVVFVPSSSTNVQVDADVISLAGSIAAPTIVEGTGVTIAPSGDPQIKVQRGVTNFGASANSATASITTVGSLSNAFARVTNVVYYSGGPSAGTSTTRNVCDLGVTCVLTDTDTVTFNRSSNGAAEDVRVYWEVWEYVGPASGPNEFVVRYHDEIAYAHTVATVDTAVTVTTLADCVPFITGIYNDLASDTLANGVFTAEMVNASGNQVRITRSSAVGGGKVSVAVVEFTGSNWTVSANNTASTSTAGSPVSVAIGTTISDWSKAFIVSSMHTNSPNHGNADNMWNVWYDDSTHINWQLNADANGTHYLVAHIVKNDLLDVQYLSSLIGGGSAPSTLAGGSGNPQTETYTISSYSGYAAVSNLQYATVIATADEDDTETNFPRFAWNYRLTDTDTLEWWRSRSSSGGSGDWVAQIIDWVNVADSGTVDGSFTTNDPTIKAGAKVIADTISLAGSLPAATIAVENGELVTPAALSATFTAFDATVDTGTSASVTADVISLAGSIVDPTVLTSATISVDPATAIITLENPNVIGNCLVEATTATASFSVQDPVLLFDHNFDVDTSSATFSIVNPIVRTDQIFEVDTLELTLTANVASVSITARATPDTIEADFSIVSPNIAGNSVHEADGQSITFSLVDPEIVTSSILSIDTLEANFTVPSPSIHGNAIIDVVVSSAELSVVDPTIQTEFKASASQTTPKIGQSAEGNQYYIGSAASVLGKTEQNAEGNQYYTGSSQSVLGKTLQQGEGNQYYYGEVEQEIKPVVQSMSATQTSVGAGSSTIGKISQSGQGNQYYTGNSTQTCARLNQAGDGNQYYYGEVEQSFASTSQEATGNQYYSGASEQDTKPVTQKATGELGYWGDILQTTKGGYSQEASGYLAYVGQAASTAPRLNQSGTGNQYYTGVAQSIIKKPVQDAIGTVLFFPGTISQTTPRISQSARAMLKTPRPPQIIHIMIYEPNEYVVGQDNPPHQITVMELDTKIYMDD